MLYGRRSADSARIWRGPKRAPARFDVPMSSGTPTNAASRPAADDAAGSRIIVAGPAKRGIALPLWGWLRGSVIASSGAPAAQPFERQQQRRREEDQQRRDGSDRRRDILADAGEHLPRQRHLVGAGEKERHHHFVEGGCEREQRAGDDARRDDGQGDAKEGRERIRAEA